MPVFAWEGKTRAGDVKKGEMNATSEDEVTQRLRQQEISASKIKKKSKSKGISFGGGGSGRVPTKSLVIFTRQFSTMIDAGLPLVQCLDLLGGAEPHKGFQKIIMSVKTDIESGATLADSMGKHPGAFNSLYVNLVAAGEVAGILDTVMTRLAMQIEKAQKLNSRIKSAFTYPTIVMCVAIVVVIGMLYKVIPTFAAMFDDMGGAALPAPTQIVMGLSDFVQAHFMVMIGLMVLAGVLFKVCLTVKSTRAVFDSLILKAPVFGPLVRKTSVARFTRTLGTMVSSGVPIIDSLDIVAKTSGNMTIEKAIMYVKERISEGQNMVDPLLQTAVFPKMVVQMIGVGEATGALDTMLNKIADFYEDEVDVAVDNMTALIEPIMMVGLGSVIGGMLIAMYLPIFEMAGAIQT